MKRTAALLACLLLTACGQKGALYLPDQAQPVVPATPTSSPAPAPAGTGTAASEEEQRRRQQQATPGNNPAGN